jgi:calcium/calmodulin-dependent protein kinase I
MGNQCIKGNAAPTIDIQEDVYIEHFFDSRWNLSKTLLGKGGFSEVYLCHRKRDNQKGAVKIFNKSKMNEDELAQVRNEVSILRKLQHPNIVRLIDYFDEPQNMYVVLEYLEGGALFDRISSKKTYTEQTARDLVYIFLSALKVCHDNNICHRDIKPENLGKNNASSVLLFDYCPYPRYARYSLYRKLTSF